MTENNETKPRGLAFAAPGSTPDYGETGAKAAPSGPTNYYEMIARIDTAEAEVAAAESILKDKKEALRVLVEEALPAAMRALGADRVDLPTGETLFVDTGTYASVPKGADKGALVHWLDANNEGAIVERAYVVGLGKKSDALVDFLGDVMSAMSADPGKFAGLVPAAHLDPVVDMGSLSLDTKVDVRIPPSSLSAMARRWVDGGKTLPADLLSVYTTTRVKVKRPKAK